MERIGDVHVGHDLVARLVHIVAHLIGFNFYQAEVSLRIDEPRIDGHAGGIHNRCAPRNGCGGGTDSSDLAILHYHHAVLDYAVSNGEQLASANRDRAGGLSLRRGDLYLLLGGLRKREDGHERKQANRQHQIKKLRGIWVEAPAFMRGERSSALGSFQSFFAL